MAKALIEKIIRNVYHEKKSILRHNVTLLKTLLECWRSDEVDLRPNTEITYQYFMEFVFYFN